MYVLQSFLLPNIFFHCTIRPSICAILRVNMGKQTDNSDAMTASWEMMRDMLYSAGLGFRPEVVRAPTRTALG